MEKQIKVLYEIFDQWNKSKFSGSLPRPILTVQSQGQRKSTMAWCTRGRIWEGEEQQHEINICAEYLNIPFEDIAEIMLHEMVHLDNRHKNIKDCSKSGSHNKKYKATAEAVGLIVTKGSKGWCQTDLSEPLKAEITLWTMDKTVFNLRRVVEQKVSKPTYGYKCSCGISIRSSKSVNAICQVCKKPFEGNE